MKNYIIKTISINCKTGESYIAYQGKNNTFSLDVNNVKPYKILDAAYNFIYKKYRGYHKLTENTYLDKYSFIHTSTVMEVK